MKTALFFQASLELFLYIRSTGPQAPVYGTSDNQSFKVLLPFCMNSAVANKGDDLGREESLSCWCGLY